MKSAQTRQALSQRDDNVRNATGTRRKGLKAKAKRTTARAEATPLSAAQKAANVAAARKAAAAKARVAARQAAGRSRSSRARPRPTSGPGSKIPSPTKRAGSTSSKQSRGSDTAARPDSARSGRSSASSGASTRIPRPRSSLEGRPSASPAQPAVADAPRARPAARKKNATRTARRVVGAGGSAAAAAKGKKRSGENQPTRSIFRSKAPSPNLLTKRLAASKFAAKHANAGRMSMIAPSRASAGAQAVKPGRSSMILPSSRALLGRSGGASRSVLASGALHRSTGVLGRDLPTFAQRLAQSERSARRPRYGPNSSAAVDMGAAPVADADGGDDQFEANPQSLAFITAPVPSALASASEEFVSADQALWRMTQQAQVEERKRVSIYGGALRKPMAAKRKSKAAAAPASRTLAASPPSPPTRRPKPRAGRTTPPNVPRKSAKTPRDSARRHTSYSTIGSATKAPSAVASRKLVDAMLSPGAAPCSVSRKKRSVLSESRSARRVGSAARFSARGSEKRGIGTPAQRVRRSAKKSATRGSAIKATDAVEGGDEEGGVMDDAVVKLDFGGLAVTSGFAPKAALLESTPEDDCGSDSDDNGAAALAQAAADHFAPESFVSGAGGAGAGASAAVSSPARAPPPIKLEARPVAETWRSSLASPPPGSMSASSAFNAVGTLSSGRSELDLRASLASLPSLQAAASPVKPSRPATAGSGTSADPLPSRLLRSASLESASRLHAAMLVRGTDDVDEEVASIVSTSSQNMSGLRLSIESLHAGDEAAVMTLGTPLAPCPELAGEMGDAHDEDMRRVYDPVAACLAEGPMPEALASAPQEPRSVSRRSSGGDNIVAVRALRRNPTV